MQFDAQDPDRTIVLVHHEDARGIWATRGRSIFHAEFDVPIGAEERVGAEGRAGPWRKIDSFPASPPVDLAIGRAARRLLRSEKCNVYPTRSNKLFGIRQGVAYRLDNGGATALFEIQGVTSCT